MKSICFERTGDQRKALVVAIGEITGIKPKYMGAPGFAYSVGGYTITKDGTLACDEQEDTFALLAALAERGFIPERETTAAVAEPVETETDDVFSIELPSDGMHDAQRERLNRLVSSKAALIRAALSDNLSHGTRGLPIDYMDDKVGFPWFKAGMDADVVDAWSRFVCALRDTAIKQKRVVMSNKPYDGSEKYAMRCFLLKLGFIGEEYKVARKILLANLSGNGSHKNPKEDTPAPANDEQDAEYKLAEALADAELIYSVNASFGDDDVDEGDRLVRGGLCGVPHTDVNYASYLRQATDSQLGEAIAYMESSPEGNKGRIATCKRELTKRENAAEQNMGAVI